MIPSFTQISSATIVVNTTLMDTFRVIDISNTFSQDLATAFNGFISFSEARIRASIQSRAHILITFAFQVFTRNLVTLFVDDPFQVDFLRFHVGRAVLDSQVGQRRTGLVDTSVFHAAAVVEDLSFLTFRVFTFGHFFFGLIADTRVQHIVFNLI
jgi:hypothetical protein